MSLTIPQSICASLTLAALLAAPAARAQDILEETKRQNAIAAQKLEADQREALIEAYKVGTLKKDPKAAIDILRPMLVRIEEDRSLSEARRAQLIRAFKTRIRDYEAGPAAPPRPVGSDEKRFADNERQSTFQRDQERGADIQRTLAQVAELHREGKSVEAAQLADTLTRKYGNSPATTITGRTTRMADSLRTLRSIRNERDQRYTAAMRELVRSSMPVVGDIEFPPREKWLALTKRRTEVKLTEREQALLKALNAPITFSVQDKPFQEVLNALEKATGLVFQVDKTALDSLMIRYDTPVTLDVQNTSARSALKKMLGDIGLTFIIKNETIKITTPELAAREMTTRTYYVGDLITLSNFTIDPAFNQLQMVQNISGLIAFIQSIDPQTWNTGGGQGTIVFSPQSMSIIVRQSAEMHFVLMGALR